MHYALEGNKGFPKITAFDPNRNLLPVKLQDLCISQVSMMNRSIYKVKYWIKGQIRALQTWTVSNIWKWKYTMSEEWKDISISVIGCERVTDLCSQEPSPDSSSANEISKKQCNMPWLNVHIVQLYCEQAWNDSLTCSSGPSAPRTARPRSADGSHSCDTCDDVCLSK